jgi:hypothetical protein
MICLIICENHDNYQGIGIYHYLNSVKIVNDIYHTLHTFKRPYCILHLDLHATMMKQINQ